MRGLIIFLFIIIGALIGTTIYYSNKSTNSSLKNEKYKDDISVLKKDLKASEELTEAYRVKDSLMTISLDSLNAKYDKIIKDEEVKKKYDKMFDDIGNADWHELDSILTRHGIFE